MKSMKKADIVEFYAWLILNMPSTRGQFIPINFLIISKWSGRALIDIKEAAWKIVNEEYREMHRPAAETVPAADEDAGEVFVQSLEK